MKNDRILSIGVFLVAILISFAIVRMETGAWTKRNCDAKTIQRLRSRNAELENAMTERRRVQNDFIDRLIYDNAMLSKSNKVYEARIKLLEKKCAEAQSAR